MKPNYTLKATATEPVAVTATTLQGFEVAGSDGVFHAADATVQGNQVIVHSDDVDAVTPVRYLWGARAQQRQHALRLGQTTGEPVRGERGVVTVGRPGGWKAGKRRKANVRGFGTNLYGSVTNVHGSAPNL
ncbi:hypothetical protein [Bifidobacterium parmae]|uniref:Sialic acid-specific 9-O-acetylesterase n=1 Tax=Bifidobacterium parmae TaxID=361854 RepID=A0A2N5J3I8_9BIFI|nr:hypothetical protein [Bifidobacterium parmae]PLS28800.1 Sialic acid-specific 9-O-acetylesterase [Bifidobacterium parmae]